PFEVRPEVAGVAGAEVQRPQESGFGTEPVLQRFGRDRRGEGLPLDGVQPGEPLLAPPHWAFCSACSAARNVSSLQGWRAPVTSPDWMNQPSPSAVRPMKYVS